MEKIIDLHIHTNCSDGSLTPFEIIDAASTLGLDTISITDHDTILAYTDELINYAKDKKINLIPGVEISTKINKCGIHILGYNIDYKNEEFQTRLAKLQNARHDYLYNVAAKLNDLGYVLNTEELDKIEAVTKAHIALDVIENSANKDLLIKEFGHIPNKGEFIETVMNEGCKAYVKKETITPKEAAELIRSVGGKVVIAHPVAYTYEDNLTEEDIDTIVADTKADGIEAYYIYLDRNNIKHNDIDKWLKYTKDKNLFTTFGSDFHNKDGIHPYIGLTGEDVKITSQQIDEIIENISE